MKKFNHFPLPIQSEAPQDSVWEGFSQNGYFWPAHGGKLSFLPAALRRPHEFRAYKVNWIGELLWGLVGGVSPITHMASSGTSRNQEKTGDLGQIVGWVGQVLPRLALVGFLWDWLWKLFSAFPLSRPYFFILYFTMLRVVPKSSAALIWVQFAFCRASIINLFSKLSTFCSKMLTINKKHYMKPYLKVNTDMKKKKKKMGTNVHFQWSPSPTAY